MSTSTIDRPRTFEGNGGVATSSTPAPEVYAEPREAGWIVFCSFMLGFAGLWAIFDGILAISRSKVFTANATYVFSDLRTWGWIVLTLGVLSVMAALAITTGSELARWFGIAVAAANGFGQLMFVHANPWWSMAMFTVDILIIYGLAAYAGARLRLQ